MGKYEEPDAAVKVSPPWGGQGLCQLAAAAFPPMSPSTNFKQTLDDADDKRKPETRDTIGSISHVVVRVLFLNIVPRICRLPRQERAWVGVVDIDVLFIFF